MEQKFQGSHYKEWRRYATGILRKEGLLEYVQKPTEKKMGAEEEEREDRAQTVLQAMIAFEHTPPANSAYEIWAAMEQLHGTAHRGARNDLLAALLTIRKATSESMADYVQRYEGLVLALAEKGEALTDKDKRDWLLRGLGAEFASFVMGVGANPTGITYRSMQTSLLELYPKPLAIIADQSNQLALRVQKEQPSKPRKHSGSKPVCWCCRNPGHLVRDCPLLSAVKINAGQNGQVYSITWILDSGASISMVPSGVLLSDMRPEGGGVEVASGTRLPITHRGRVNVQGVLLDALVVDGLTGPLLSVPQLMEQGFRLQMSKGGGTISRGGKAIVINAAAEAGALHTVKGTAMIAKTADEWHRSLAHVSMPRVMAAPSHVAGMRITDAASSSVSCEACSVGRATRGAQRTESYHAARYVGEIISADLMVLPEVSAGLARYASVIADHHSGWTDIRFLQSKQANAVLGHILEFIAFLERQAGCSVKILRTDNGGEYVAQETERVLRFKGIIHQTTAPHHPSANGVSERKNRTIMDAVRSMLADAGLENIYWAHAANEAVEVHNRVLVREATGKTPFETVFGYRPSAGHFHKFGAKCVVLDESPEHTKIDPKGLRGRYLGHVKNSEAHFVLVEGAGVVTSRSIRIIEWLDGPDTVPAQGGPPPGFEHMHAGSVQPDVPLVATAASTVEATRTEQAPAAEATNGESGAPGTIAVPPTTSEGSRVGRRNPERETRFQGSYNESELAKGQSKHRALLSRTSADADAPPVREALAGEEADKWRAAIDEEVSKLDAADTWEVVDAPPGKALIDSRLILRRKRGPTGEVLKFKARLVARGFTQRPGVDYEETYAPVARFETVLAMLAVGLRNGLQIHQVDVDSAYVNASIKEELYMRPPEGVLEVAPGKVLRLRKAIYGLKQAGHEWNVLLTHTLVELGWTCSSYDACLFRRSRECGMEYLTVYVDDILIVSADVETVKTELGSRFAIKNLGRVRHLLGVTVDVLPCSRIAFLSQEPLVERKCAEFSINVPCRTPMCGESYLMPNEGQCSASDERLYREMVGVLQYISQRTRPDIAFAAGMLGRFGANPSEAHISAARRVFGYLLHTKGHGIVLDSRDTSLRGVRVHCDSDWAGDRSDRKSTSGMVVSLFGMPIHWSSSKQKCISRSTMEAEYIAAAEGCAEGLWLRRLLTEMGVDVEKRVSVFSDNMAAIESAKGNRANASGPKHIDIKYHFIRNEVAQGRIDIEYLPSLENLADIMTKPLGRSLFGEHRQRLQVRHRGDLLGGGP
jgi:transposase InsO family protein